MEAKVLLERNNGHSFLQEIEDKRKVEISSCFQCKKCSNGCPVNFAMDIMPHKIIHMIRLGLKDEVLKSSAMWVCSSCETCTTRCPNNIDIAKLMDVLRQMATDSGFDAAQKDVPIFHSAFLSSVKKRGRIHELGMIGEYKLKTGDLMKDSRLGWEMFKRGKLKILPSGIKGRREIRGIFDEAGRRKRS